MQSEINSDMNMSSSNEMIGAIIFKFQDAWRILATII